MEATGCEYEKADEVLKQTDNNCKEAIVMILLNVSREEAIEKIEKAGGHIREALK